MKNFMKLAIEQAELALIADEFPIGAVIVKSNQIIASGHNMVEKMKNPTLHAEMIAINQALEILDDKYLTNCDMYVTLEPCMMCFKAISLVKLRRLYISVMNTNDDYSIERLSPKALDLNHMPEIITGICEEESANLFKIHLKKLRK